MITSGWHSAVPLLSEESCAIPVRKMLIICIDIALSDAANPVAVTHDREI